jgi:MoaA/NifB/PqqE/SkfB family radical SAM enzyme
MYRLSAPLGVQIEITEGCHQRCIHCYNLIRPEAYKPRGELTQKQLVTTLEIIAKHGVLDVNLTGGEPMLRKNVVFAMLKRARELGMRVGLNTTAFHVTTQDAQQLYDVGLRTALVSLLGVGQTHNGVANVSTGFERTVQGIKALVAAGIHVQVNMVVSTLNLHEVEAVGSLASDLGAFCFSAETWSLMFCFRCLGVCLLPRKRRNSHRFSVVGCV